MLSAGSLIETYIYETLKTWDCPLISWPRNMIGNIFLLVIWNTMELKHRVASPTILLERPTNIVEAKINSSYHQVVTSGMQHNETRPQVRKFPFLKRNFLLSFQPCKAAELLLTVGL